jgi:hypothetical protein
LRKSAAGNSPSGARDGIAVRAPLCYRSRLLGVKLAGISIFFIIIAVISFKEVRFDEIRQQGTADGTSPTGPTLTQPVSAAPKLPAHLVVQTSSPTPMSEEPAPLGLTLRGQANDAVIVIMGLLPGMTLSAGRPINASAWLLTIAEIGDAWVGPPKGFAGAADLVAELRLPDGTVVDRQTIRVEWQTSTAIEHTNLSVAAQNESNLEIIDRQTSRPLVQRHLDQEEIGVFVKRGQDLIAEGDIAGARFVLERAADANDAVAALTLGMTYDPVVLRHTKFQGVRSDAATARAWYDKALALGSLEARERIERLADVAR